MTDIFEYRAKSLYELNDLFNSKVEKLKKVTNESELYELQEHFAQINKYADKILLEKEIMTYD